MFKSFALAALTAVASAWGDDLIGSSKYTGSYDAGYGYG